MQNLEDEILVSIIVLTYNHEKSVKRTLDSILAQRTQYKYEIIIGDDASKDNTRAICEDYISRYSQVALMPYAPNKGVVRNYVDCLRACSGKYIMGCAGDDWWHNVEKIQAQVTFLESHTSCPMVFSGCYIHNEDSNIQTLSQPSTGYYKFNSLLLNYPISALTICYRNYPSIREELEHVIINGWGIEDYPLALYLASQGDLYCMEGVYGTYSVIQGSISNCADIMDKERFEGKVREIRCFYAQKLDLLNDDIKVKIDDVYYTSLSTIGIRYNDKKYCYQNLLKIHRKRFKEYVKIALCKVPFGFRYLRYKCRNINVI